MQTEQTPIPRSLEETEALLYGERSANAFVHDQRVFELFEPGVRLQSGIETEQISEGVNHV